VGKRNTLYRNLSLGRFDRILLCTRIFFFFPWLFRLDASVLGGTLSVFPQGRGSGNGVIQVKVMRYDTGCIISPSNDEVYSVLFSLSVLLNFLLFAGAHQKDQEN